MTSPDATAPNQTRIAVWFVLVIIVPLCVGLLYGYTDDLRCVPELKQRVQTMEAQIAPMQEDLKTMQGDLHEIKTDLKWIAKQMGK